MRWDVDEATGCWVWAMSRTPNGYGKVYDRGQYRCAHRVVYEQLRGPIPNDWPMDHLCRNRACVNPDHLEPVTASENSLRADLAARRKTHCPKGHPYSGDNLLIDSTSGARRCKMCRKEQLKRASQMSKLRKCGALPRPDDAGV